VADVDWPFVACHSTCSVAADRPRRAASRGRTAGNPLPAEQHFHTAAQHQPLVTRRCRFADGCLLQAQVGRTNLGYPAAAVRCSAWFGVCRVQHADDGLRPHGDTLPVIFNAARDHVRNG
jgi:hypothetical protein